MPTWYLGKALSNDDLRRSRKLRSQSPPISPRRSLSGQPARFPPCRRLSDARAAAASGLTVLRAAVGDVPRRARPPGRRAAIANVVRGSAAVAEMVGWRRERTASMISLGWIPCRFGAGGPEVGMAELARVGRSARNRPTASALYGAAGSSPDRSRARRRPTYERDRARSLRAALRAGRLSELDGL